MKMGPPPHPRAPPSGSNAPAARRGPVRAEAKAGAAAFVKPCARAVVDGLTLLVYQFQYKAVTKFLGDIPLLSRMEACVAELPPMLTTADVVRQAREREADKVPTDLTELAASGTEVFETMPLLDLLHAFVTPSWRVRVRVHDDEGDILVPTSTRQFTSVAEDPSNPPDELYVSNRVIWSAATSLLWLWLQAVPAVPAAPAAPAVPAAPRKCKRKRQRDDRDDRDDLTNVVRMYLAGLQQAREPCEKVLGACTDTALQLMLQDVVKLHEQSGCVRDRLYQALDRGDKNDLARIRTEITQNVEHVRLTRERLESWLTRERLESCMGMGMAAGPPAP
jgi:hypothetical protein